MASLKLEDSIVDDRYEIRGRLGHGSYSEIFEAFDLERGRMSVIVKALNTTLQGTPEPDLERTLVENFQNEAIALDSVSHANVVRRLGHGTAADLAGRPFHYLVLENLPGGDLMQLCRRAPLTIPQMLHYVRQVCEALAEAHGRGVIHRDIKPSNLLLTADRQTIKLADFGVAKLGASDFDGEVTRVGTDLYAPPEHNPHTLDDGTRERLTPSADVYSLAKTVYAAVTGRAPREFARRPITSLPREIEREPWAPKLLATLRRATADSVAERYPGVRAFWDDLAVLPELEADDDERTSVRPREGLREATPVAPAAPAPNFRRAAPEEAPRVVVQVSAPMVQQGAYSYTEDLKDLVGSGWRRRIAVIVLVLVLIGIVAGVFVEVRRRVAPAEFREGVVTAPSLTLRDGPSMAASPIGTLPGGTRVRIVGQEAGGPWFEVEVVEWGGPVGEEQADRGWVHSRFVELQAPL